MLSVDFLPATHFALGFTPLSVTVGDFNGDGKDDLATANSGSNGVSVLLGDGLGGFAAATNFAVGGFFPRSVTVGDFNGDGKDDLATANVNSSNVSVLLGDGLGAFAAATIFAVGSAPFSVSLGDFNEDGKDDLATANFGADSVSVLLGDGLGAFAAATNFADGSDPFSVTVGDFNGDGKDDVATANSGSNSVSVLLGDGLGAFAAATNFVVGAGPKSVSVGDFNGDGKDDLATANYDSGNLSVLLGDGLGAFAAATNFVVGAGPQSVTVGDFNGDGKDDLATANYDSGNLSVLLGDGLGGFAAATNFAFGNGNYPFSVTLGDFNGDGKDDLATAIWGSYPNPGSVSLLLNSTLIIPDRFEPNDSFAAATNLGIVGLSHSEPDLSIHAAGNADFFQFTAAYTTTAVVDLTFLHAAGDIDVEVYSEAQSYLAGAKSLTDNEHLAFAVTAGQTYFLRVFGYSGTTNHRYDLAINVPSGPDRFEPNDSFAASADLGAIAFTRSEPDLSIHASSNDDYFRFTAPFTTTASAELNFLHAQGDVDVRVYDALQQQIAISNSVIDSEYAAFAVTAGQTYYVRVYGYNGAINPHYDLTISVPISPDRFEPNDSFAVATDLGTVANDLFEPNLSIHAANDDDYFRFTAAHTTEAVLNLAFLHADGDIDVYVYDAEMQTIGYSGTVFDYEDVRFDVTAGQTYYIYVYGDQSATNPHYDLTLHLRPVSTVVGRHIFYNQSKFDGNSSAINASDDAAIATDKVALQFSGSTTAPLSAFTSYSRGINGIMVDIAGPFVPLSLADFTFKVGTSSTVSNWANAPAPSGFSVRAGFGLAVSRVEITWANNAIQNSWLQVIVEGNDALGGYNTNTRLEASDVFFFGNRIGDTFISSPATIVSTAGADGLAVRNNPGILQPITNVYDFDRNQTVSGGDELIARNNAGILTRNLTWSPPAAPLTAEGDDDSGSAVASALAAKSSPSLPRVPGWISSRLATVDLNSGPVAKLFTALADAKTPTTRSLLLAANEFTNALDLEDELLELLLDGWRWGA